MIRGTQQLWRKYVRWLAAESRPRSQHGEYRKWLRFYLDFCTKYKHEYVNAASLTLFIDKLASKCRCTDQREQAKRAVALYYRMAGERGAENWEEGTGKTDAVCEAAGEYGHAGAHAVPHVQVLQTCCHKRLWERCLREDARSLKLR